jgi:hypothetical protein
MADNKPQSAAPAGLETEVTSTRDDVALELFIHRSSGPGARLATAEVAKTCFRDAETFLKVQADVKAGKLEIAEPTGPQLKDWRAPNLKPTHPHNLVSRAHGNLAKVAEILEWLESNPLAKTFDELGWDEPTTSLARVLFPEFIVKPKKARV